MAFDLLEALEASVGSGPVSIVDFAEGEKYCNKKLYPRQRLLLKLFFLEDLTPAEDAILDYWIAGGRDGTEIVISPQIRERIADLKAQGYEHFKEIVLVGGRRCSKGFITGLALAKLMFDTLQHDDPAAFYGIDPTKEIYYSCIATSQDQAKKFQYADFSSSVNACGAMQRFINKTQELEFSVKTETDIRQEEAWKRQGRKVMRDTSKLRGAALPANASSIRGSTTMAAAFDEFAFFMQGDSAQSDNECFEALKPSLNQFGRHAMLFCCSSPYSKVGKFYERFNVGIAVSDETGLPTDPNVLSLQFPSWALYEGWWEDEEFVADPHTPKKCVVASPDWDPERKVRDPETGLETEEYFYTADDRNLILTARDDERQNPGKFKVEQRGKWAETIASYLTPERVDQMFSGIPFKDEAGVSGYHALRTNWNDSTYMNRYKAHLDPSSTTAGFGFSLAHNEPIIIDGVEQQHVVFDIIKRWQPQDFPEGVIQWEPIMEELIGYIDIFRPFEVTFDQFNSAAPIQFVKKELRRRGISETRVYEKTSTSQHNWNRAEIFKTALYMGLLHAPYDLPEHNQHAALELKFLQEIKTGRIPKVEKQDVGPIQTKDMADTMMECVETLIGNLIAGQTRIELAESPLRPGAIGGYPIGGPSRGGKGSSPFAGLHAARMGEQAVGSGGQGARSRRSAPPRSWGAKPGYRNTGR